MDKKRFGLFPWMLVLFLMTAVSAPVFAAGHPFQASLTPDIAIHSRTARIEGLALSIWGENPQKVLSLGLVNGSTGDSAGFSWGFLLNYADSYRGVHWAMVNFTKGNFLGWQHGFLNYTDQNLKGVQTGFVNYAGRVKGLQLGFVNYAEKADTGVQLGLLNLLPQNSWFREFPDALAPGMVLVNWRF